MLKICYREMRDDDLKQVLSIERQSFPTPWSYSMFKNEMLNVFSEAIVAEAETEENKKEIIGYACYWLIGDEIHITNIATEPRYRRRRIGEGILVRIMAKAREEGMSEITLEVRVSNIAAQRMYTKLGFLPRGVRRRYYSDTGEDAIIMTLEGIH